MQSTGPYCYTSQPGTSLNVFQLDTLDSSPPSAESPYLDPGVYETEPEVRRRIDRACDACRRRKTKCDGPRMSDNICSNCTQTRKLCTYVYRFSEASKPRGPPKAYITGLEDKLEKLEAILKNLYPGQDFLEELGPPVIRGSWKTDSSGSITGQIHHRDSTLSQRNTLHSDTQHQPISAKSSTDDLGRHRAPSRMRQTSHLIFNAQSRVHIPSSDFRESTSETETSDNSSLDTESGTPAVVRASRKLKLRENEAVAGGIDYQNRYHGKSSPAGLIDAARKFKELTIMEGSNPGSRLSSDQPQPYLASNLPRGISPGRSVFWTSPRWELMWEGIHDDSPEVIPSILLAFPPADLACDLIDLYFLHVNPQVPLLHRPTFEKQWKESLHHRNMWYACLVMCVFAVASRWSDDARVLPENSESPTGELDWSRAGWSYFYVGLGVHRVRRSLLYPATLFEVQTFTLLAMFLRGTASYPVGSLVLSVGLRKAQDVGSHQKKTYQNKPNVNEELWKRAFWCLVVFDRLGAASLGRACCVGEEDYDLDMPLEVDDEYWETDDPDLAFQQPAGVPSQITFFNHFIRLTQIMAFGLKTIYAVNKSQLFPGIIYKDWRNDVLDQLNSALANWEATVPAYLRWSDNFSDQILANQVATLYTTYHLTKMMILRPFLPSVPAECSSTRTGFITSSLEKSLESALSCLRVLKQERRFGLSNYPNLINVAHLTAGTLLVRVWELESQKDILADVKPPIAQSIDLFMVDVRICLNFLECIQHRWPFASSLLSKLRETLPGTQSQIPLAFPAQHSSHPPTVHETNPVVATTRFTTSSSRHTQDNLSSAGDDQHHGWQSTLHQGSSYSDSEMQNGHKPGPRNRPTCPLPSQYGPRVLPPIDRDQHTQARQQFYDPHGENWSASVPVPPRPRTLSISSVNGTHQFPIRRTSHPELSSRKYTVSEHTTPNNCRTDTLDSRHHESYADDYHNPRPVQVELLPSRQHPPPVSTWPLRPTRVQDPTNISYEQ